MDRIKRLLLGVYYKNVTQVFAPLRASGLPGDGGLDNVQSGLLSVALP
jgi:hypothetical protein